MSGEAIGCRVNGPTVSVAIPCYNGGRYIREAIESALGQTAADLEVVVLDDGSTDRSGEIVQAIGDPRIRYLRQDNRGLAATRNRLIREARGEYVAFLDQDDYWHPDKLERQLAMFRADARIALVYSDCFVVNAEGVVLGRWSRRNRFYRGHAFGPLLERNFIPLVSVIMPRAVFAELGEFQPYKICEEYDLFLRCAAHYAIDYVEQPLACYRIHSGQFSRNYEIAVRELVSIYEGWRRQIDGGDRGLAASLSRSLAMAYYNAGKSAVYVDRDMQKARGYLRASRGERFLWRSMLFQALSALGPSATRMARSLTVKALGTYSLSG